MSQIDFTKSKIDDLYIVPEYVQKYIIEKGLKKSPVMIDALAFKVYGSVPLEEVERCFCGLLTFDIPITHAFFGYTCASMTDTGHSLKLTSPSDASVSAGTVFSKDEAYFSLTGRDCALLNKNFLMINVIKALNDVGNKYPFEYVDFTGEHHHCSGIQFKRIDICRDCFDDRFDYLFQFDESNLNDFIVSKNVNFQWHRSASSGKWNPGWTLYCGKRTSNIFVRLYDKRAEQGLDKKSVQESLGFDIPHWCRLEFEIKYDGVSKICACICDGVDLEDIYADLVRERFNVKPVLNEGYSSRSYAEMADWLVDFTKKDKFCEELTPNIEKNG